MRVAVTFMSQKPVYYEKPFALHSAEVCPSRAVLPRWVCFCGVQRVEARCKKDCEINVEADIGKGKIKSFYRQNVL